MQGWLLSFAYGFIFFIALNVIRIVCLFSVGTLGVRFFGPQQGTELVLAVFHMHAGYLLYGSGLILYFQSITAIMNWEKKFELTSQGAKMVMTGETGH